MPPKIRERLNLDHFFVSVSASEIQDLMPLTQRLRHCTSKRVVSGNTHWDGIYLISRTGAYFEIVHYADAGPFGIAVSAAQPQYTDTRKIKEEFPDLDWAETKMLSAKNEPWFDSLSTSKESAGRLAMFYSWVMHYHFSHWEDRARLPGTRTIDRFKMANLTMGTEHLEELKDSVAWMPGVQDFGKNSVRLEIPDREGSLFTINIDLESAPNPLRFRRLEMQLARGERVEGLQVGRFTLQAGPDETLILEAE